MSIAEFCKMYINETLHSNKDIMYIDEENIAVALAFIQMIILYINSTKMKFSSRFSTYMMNMTE